MCDKRVGYAVNDRLLRLGVRANLALGIWVGSEESLVVQLPDASAAANWLRLLHLGDLWCVAADLAGLCEGTVDFAHCEKAMQNRRVPSKRGMAKFGYRLDADDRHALNL